MTGIYPGSFDPITNGHLDIIIRAAKLCEQLIVLVSYNPTKSAGFTPDERVLFIKKSIAALPYKNIEVDSWSGLLINYFKAQNADVIIKGLRALSDFEHEFQMAHVNRDLCAGAETIFLCSDVSSTFISSGVVKQVASFGGDISGLVPPAVLPELTERFKNF